ncbi:hypothetical protein Acr_23g0017780 [Actinidia rufa]|uniref:Uncharacterized protein n=1 Tax=Actinidia rufa TaxID=165716 RepID=A0A7J0GRI4_9ERIC|nr:hypothetical protein Acr_23g0017780 [Actinidia rufa]
MTTRSYRASRPTGGHLPDACQLSSHRLYFLVMEEAVADDAVFESLVWAAVARGLIVVPEWVNKYCHRRRPLPLPESGCSRFDSGGEVDGVGSGFGARGFWFQEVALETTPADHSRGDFPTFSCRCV